MKIANGSKLLFIGDSITDCGRARPVGEGKAGTLGDGYVNQVEALLLSASPTSRIRVVNVGTSGDTVRDLKARWQSDVLDLKPDWLSVMVGINDVWRHLGRPMQTEHHIHPDEFERLYRDILSQVRQSLKGLVLMSPFYIEANPADPMRAMMDKYSAIVRRMATEFDAIFVDIQAAFEQTLTYLSTQMLAGDRVHPNHIGSMVITRAFLNAVGFDWNAR